MSRFDASALPTAEGISDLTESVTAFLQEQHVDARATHHVALVLEEILTNLGTHGQCRLPAAISLAVEAAEVRLQITEKGTPFDPRLAPEPALDIAADRPVGGLGLHLVRKLSSALEYVTKDGENCTTITIARRYPAA